MVKKPFNHLNYADLFPLVKKFFKKNTKWHPLTGDLPFDFLSQRPDALDMRCVELILKARGLWGVLSWNKDDPDLSMTQVLFDCVPDILSRSATAAGKILGQLGPDQIPESHLLEEASQETGRVEAYKIFSVLSIYLAWNALKKIFLGEQRIDDPEPLKQTLLAEAFFNKAFSSWQLARFDKGKRENLSKIAKVSRTNPGILAATEEAFKKSEYRTAPALWKYLNKNYRYDQVGEPEFTCEIGINFYRVFFDRRDSKLTCVISWEKGDKQFSKDQRIKFGTFKKNYFPKIRKKLET
jgi:hypothetical protein